MKQEETEEKKKKNKNKNKNKNKSKSKNKNKNKSKIASLITTECLVFNAEFENTYFTFFSDFKKHDILRFLK